MRGEHVKVREKEEGNRMKRNKYGNRRTKIGEEKFDSKKEARRWLTLKEAEREGKIEELERQVRYELIGTQELADGSKMRKCSYVGDFRYKKNGEEIVEDVKAVDRKSGRTVATEVYRIKKKLMKQVWGIEIQEV